MPQSVLQQLVASIKAAGKDAVVWTNKADNPRFVFVSKRDLANEPNFAKFDYQQVKQSLRPSTGKFPKQYVYYVVSGSKPAGKRSRKPANKPVILPEQPASQPEQPAV